MYRLYYSPGAASMVVHWLLIELDVTFELHRLDLAAGEHKRPDYLALNPAGVVPTLLIDGRPQAETAAILLWLGQRHGDRGLAPAVEHPDYPRYLQFMLRLANTLQPAFRGWFYPHEPAGAAHADAAKEVARVAIEAEFERWNDMLADAGPYLLGDDCTVADFYLTMLMRWSRNMPRPATAWPALASLAARMKQRPSFARLYAEEGLTEWA